MKEQQILKYLGVTKNFNNVSQLKEYYLHFEKGNYFSVNNVMCKSKFNTPIDKNNHGFSVILSYKNKHSDLRLNNQRKKLYKIYNYKPYDHGHIIAVSLINYLNISNDCKSSLVTTQENIFPQFPRANRNKKSNIGQARFENWLNSYIEKHEDENIKYEIEKIYRDDCLKNEQSVPIGIRLFACKLNDDFSNLNCDLSKKIKLPFHVFIPNYETTLDNGEDGYDEKYCLDKIDNDITHKVSSLSDISDVYKDFNIIKNISAYYPKFS